jgi:restriction endonuclease Mrr
VRGDERRRKARTSAYNSSAEDFARRQIPPREPKDREKGRRQEEYNEELEFLIEAEDRIPREEEKREYDHDIERLFEEGVDEAMAELRKTLPAEELEIYEKCYRLFKRSNSNAIRWYTAEQILQRALKLRGVEG